MLGWLLKAFARESELVTGVEYTARQVQTRTPGVGPSFGNLEDFAVLSAAMPSAPSAAHSWTGARTAPVSNTPSAAPGTTRQATPPGSSSPRAVPNRHANTLTDLIGVYLSPGRVESGEGQQDILKYIRPHTAGPVHAHLQAGCVPAPGERIPRPVRPGSRARRERLPHRHDSPGRPRVNRLQPPAGTLQVAVLGQRAQRGGPSGCGLPLSAGVRRLVGRGGGHNARRDTAGRSSGLRR